VFFISRFISVFCVRLVVNNLQNALNRTKDRGEYAAPIISQFMFLRSYYFVCYVQSPSVSRIELAKLSVPYLYFPMGFITLWSHLFIISFLYFSMRLFLYASISLCVNFSMCSFLFSLWVSLLYGLISLSLMSHFSFLISHFSFLISHFSISLFSYLDLIMCKQYLNICNACSALHDPATQEANIIGNPTDAKKNASADAKLAFVQPAKWFCVGRFRVCKNRIGWDAR
jgi:hypothetical protein